MLKEDMKTIPIIDCPMCGVENVPLSFDGEFEDKSGRHRPNIVVWSCSSCGKIPNLVGDVKVKRYISLKELKELGWSFARWKRK